VLAAARALDIVGGPGHIWARSAPDAIEGRTHRVCICRIIAAAVAALLLSTRFAEAQQKWKAVGGQLKLEVVTPFFLVMCLGIALVMLFPALAVWLPNTMRGN